MRRFLFLFYILNFLILLYIYIYPTKDYFRDKFEIFQKEIKLARNTEEANRIVYKIHDLRGEYLRYHEYGSLEVYFLINGSYINNDREFLEFWDRKKDKSYYIIITIDDIPVFKWNVNELYNADYAMI